MQGDSEIVDSFVLFTPRDDKSTHSIEYFSYMFIWALLQTMVDEPA